MKKLTLKANEQTSSFAMTLKMVRDEIAELRDSANHLEGVADDWDALINGVSYAR